MTNGSEKVQTFKLSDVVVRRSVPMTSKGCDYLRAAHKHIAEYYENELGTKVSLPFPVVIHMVLSEYCKENKLGPYADQEPVDSGD